MILTVMFSSASVDLACTISALSMPTKRRLDNFRLGLAFRKSRPRNPHRLRRDSKPLRVLRSPIGKGHDDHLVGHLRTVEEFSGIEVGIRVGHRPELGVQRSPGLGDGLDRGIARLVFRRLATGS